MQILLTLEVMVVAVANLGALAILDVAVVGLIKTDGADQLQMVMTVKDLIQEMVAWVMTALMATKEQ